MISLFLFIFISPHNFMHLLTIRVPAANLLILIKRLIRWCNLSYLEFTRIKNLSVHPSFKFLDWNQVWCQKRHMNHDDDRHFECKHVSQFSNDKANSEDIYEVCGP